MSRAALIAPLSRLPANRDRFDYLLSTAAKRGQLVDVPFRKSVVPGVVLRLLEKSAHAQKTISKTHGLLLSPAELDWLEEAAADLPVGLGILINHVWGGFTAKIRPPNRAFLASKRLGDEGLRYFWYKDPPTRKKAILAALNQLSTPGVIIAPSQAQIQEYAATLRDLKIAFSVLDAAAGNPTRRQITLDWLTGRKIILANHLGVWLPFLPHTTIILDDPTNEYHTQWDGSDRYNNRQIIAGRQKFNKDNLWVIAHSPDTLDLARATAVPTMRHWPKIIDRTADERGTKTQLISDQVTTMLQTATRAIIIAPHLRPSRQWWCVDCRKILPRTNITTCPHCRGVHLRPLGFDLPQAKLELKQKQISAAVEFVTMATALNMSLAEFDLIVDVAADFPLYEITWQATERAGQRWRALAATLPPEFAGQWLATTDYPELAAWKMRDAEGTKEWWQTEGPLRQRFHYPPYGKFPSLPPRQKAKNVLS